MATGTEKKAEEACSCFLETDTKKETETKKTEAAASEKKAEKKPVVVVEKAVEVQEKTIVEEEEEKKMEEADAAVDEAAIIEVTTGSFQEESNLVSELADPEQKALAQLKELVAAALASGEFDLPPPPPPQEQPADEAKTEEPAKTEVTAEAPVPEAPTTEEPKTEASAQEKPKTEDECGEDGVVSTVIHRVGLLIYGEHKHDPAAEGGKPDEKTVVVAEDETTKTVEAIEETIVPAAESPKQEMIWGVPLAGDDERTNTVLLKFLRAREFNAKEAMAMLKATVLWRKSFGVDALLDADLGMQEIESVVFYRGKDRHGHPICYNVYGEFQDKDLYEKAFGDEEKRERFVRWRIQLLERGIREQLDFAPSGVCSMVQVTDLKNSPPLLGKHRAVTNQTLALLQDNYPEFIAQKVFINVPWWYLAANKVMSPFLTQRTKSKFTFCSPARSAEILFRHIAPEQVPIQFGGLFKEDDTEFSTSDAVTELTVKPLSVETIEIPATENTTLVWELRVLGWEVTYAAEFTPAAEGGYTVIVQKTRKVPANEEPIMKGTFKVTESGKIVLSVNNQASKKKKLLYRFKVKSSTESA